MKLIELIIISILPIILLGIYVYNKDKNKEPTKLLIKLFLGGILSCFLTIFLTLILSIFFPIVLENPEDLDLISLIFHVVIGIGFTEEISKWIIGYLIAYNEKNFDEAYDMIIYCVFVSLGFACLENILYVMPGGIITGILRAILSVPAHASFGIIMGYYLGLSKISEMNNSKNLQIKNIIYSILIPILMHSIFDYCIFSKNIICILLFFIFVIFMYIYANKKLNIFARVTTKLKYQNNYCTNCGRKVNSNYCPNCGQKNE